MTWALKRQIFYLAILIFFVSIFAFIIIYPSFNKAPTCSDFKQNGDETGVDCGGMCERACMAETDDISVMWARAFRVIPGRYNAVAYITNHNKSSAIKKINYRFRFGDANNVYIGKREGSTYVPPGGNFAVFEPGIDMGNSVPVYVTFEFTEPPLWLQVPEEKAGEIQVMVSNIELKDPSTTPRLSATVKNNSLFNIPNVSVVAILHEAGGNAISASKTLISELGPLQNANINFTWPEPLEGTVVENELIPMYDVFSAELR